jgi:tRNA (cytidine/uridine-2'-O-)-methyltransferase
MTQDAPPRQIPQLQAQGLNVRLAMFQPDQPQNVGAMFRLGACFDVPVDIIEPCGFPLNAAAVRRAAMDYRADITRHTGWAAFVEAPERQQGRLVLFTTKAAVPLAGFVFQPGDTLLFGRESAGVPDEVHEAATARVIIPLAPGQRSLNVVGAASIGLWEAIRMRAADRN